MALATWAENALFLLLMARFLGGHGRDHVKIRQKADHCWRHCLHFASLAYDFAHRSQIITESFSSLRVKFKEISFQKRQDFWVAKALMNSYTFFVKLSFQTKHLAHRAQIYRESYSCRIFSIFSTNISVAWSKTEMLMLMRQDCKQRFPLQVITISISETLLHSKLHFQCYMSTSNCVRLI